MEIDRLNLSILKDGKMGDESRTLLGEAGFNFKFIPRVDIADGTNFPLRLRLQRNAVIGADLLQGLSDLAILGLDMAEEADPRLIRLMPLGLAGCRLYLGVRNDVPYESPQDLEGLRVATSYTTRAEKYFRQENVNVQIIPRPGGEETFVLEGNAESCIVISETGTSFKENKITARELLLESEAYLLASPNLREKGSERIVEQFLRRIVSVIRGRFYTGIVMNAPQGVLDNVVNFLPSAESPTIAKLEKEGWFAVSSLIPKTVFWDLVFKLQEAGAKDIYEQTIKKVAPNTNDPEVTRMMRAIYRETWQFSNNLIGGES